MNADRDTFARTAKRSISFKTSEDKVSVILAFRVAIVSYISADLTDENSQATR
jgi:hypothetical protein